MTTTVPDCVPARWRDDWPRFLGGEEVPAAFVAWLDACPEARRLAEADLRGDPLLSRALAPPLTPELEALVALLSANEVLLTDLERRALRAALAELGRLRQALGRCECGGVKR